MSILLTLALIAVAPLVYLLYSCVHSVYVRFVKDAYDKNPFVTPVYKQQDATQQENMEMNRIYSRRNVPEDLDAIVIGSGISGLGMAALLSKCGKRVLVLEQHDRCGGSMHTFEEGGSEFDTGVHYIADMGEGCYCKTFLDCLCDGETEWEPLSRDSFDRILLGGPGYAKQYDMPGRGERSYRERLVSYFPSESKAIDTYLSTVKDAARGISSTLYVVMSKLVPNPLSLLMKLLSFNGKKYATTSLQAFLDKITENKELQAVLSYSHPDYGTNPATASFYIHSLITHYFVKGGAYYPVGGTRPIIEKLLSVVRKSGGDCLVRAKVHEIVVKNNKVVGVKLDRDGHVISAPLVVSSAGVRTTFGCLSKSIRQKHGLDNLVKDLTPSLAFMSIFVIFQGSPKELGFDNSNYWIYPKADVKNMNEYNYEDVYDKYIQSGGILDPANGVDIPMIYVTCQSAKDPKYSEKHPDQTSFTILIPSSYNWFSEWDNSKVKQRSTEYLQKKNALTERTLELLYAYFPILSDKLLHVSSGTPLTTNYYLNVKHGECYGSLDNDIRRFTHSFIRPETPVQGLYLTGQDLLAAGWTSALVTVLMTGSVLLKRILFRDLATPLKLARSKRKTASESNTPI